MKWIGIIFGFLTVVLAALYTLLFTSPGNAVMAPIIEKKINAQLAQDIKLETFELRIGSFAVNIALDTDNRIEAVGNYSLFSQSLDVAYRVRLNRLESLEKLTKTPLYGKFHTDGTVIGTLQDIAIKGKSDLANSKTTYSIDLKDFEPKKIKADIANADLKELLMMTGQKIFADARIMLDADFDSIDPKNLDGNIKLALNDGSFNRAVMLEDFNITLPETTFAFNVKSELKGQNIIYDMNLNSNLARVKSNGTYQIEPMKADLGYHVDFKELALLKPVTNAPLRGPFETHGLVKGDKASMLIKGTSSVAESQTVYNVNLKEFAPEQVLLTMKHAKLDKLLYLSGKPPYASGYLNINTKLDDLNPENLQGNIKVVLSKGSFNRSVMKKDFNITLPKTDFTFKTDAKLEGERIPYKMTFDSNLAKISSKGEFVPKTVGMDLDYHVDIGRLELLKPVTGMELKGPLALKGTIKGDKKELVVNGYTDLAKSKTDFSIMLEEFKPKSVSAQMKHLRLKPLFNMLSQPHYADGSIDLQIDIPDARVGTLDGIVTTTLSKGRLDGKTISKEMEMENVPNAPFSVKTHTTLSKNIIDTKTVIDSSLMSLSSKHARMDLENNLVTADYKVKIPDLKRLYFVTKQRMQGDITLFGDLRKDDHLKFTAHSDTLGGYLDAKLLDDDLHAVFKEIQTLEALDMLLYPQIFDSSLNGILDYNIASQKGVFDANLSNGRFTRNVAMDLYRQYGKRDLYKENFNGTVLSRIDQSRLDTDLFLKSRKSSISSEHMKIDSKTNRIDAKLHIVANKHPLDIYVKGNMDDPDVQIDAQKIIEKEAGKQLNKLFKKLF
ncbi:MAG: hypothetical protein B5M52_04025 [Helicobacteraceae bacterium 4484_230]|nr:MAG: hypothetical protein B5M52_04025 [Helicobacteraceae bacterium 4484_230]